MHLFRRSFIGSILAALASACSRRADDSPMGKLFTGRHGSVGATSAPRTASTTGDARTRIVTSDQRANYVAKPGRVLPDVPALTDTLSIRSPQDYVTSGPRLVAWWTTKYGLAVDGGYVAAVADQTDENNNLIGIDYASHLTVGTGLDGHASVVHDGVGGYLQCPVLTGLSVASRPVIVHVIKCSGANTGNQTISGVYSNLATSEFEIALVRISNGTGYAVAEKASGESAANGDSSFGAGGWFLAEARTDNGAGKCALHLNGSQTALGGIKLGDLYAAPAGFVIGPLAGTFDWVGEWCETQVWDSLWTPSEYTTLKSQYFAYEYPSLTLA